MKYQWNHHYKKCKYPMKTVETWILNLEGLMNQTLINKNKHNKKLLMISVNKNLGNNRKTKMNKTGKCRKNMLIKCKHKINLILCLIKKNKMN